MKPILLFLLTLLLSVSASHANADTCIVSKISGTGQPILLLPGFVSDETVWQEVASELEKHYQVHQLAIAGFGKNKACSKADSIYQQAFQQIKDYIHDNKLQKPIMVGHSMGGLMSIQLALVKGLNLAGAISVDGLPFIGPVFTRSNETTVEDLSYQANSAKGMYQRATPAQIKRMTKQGITIQTKLKEKYQHLLDMAGKSDPITAGSTIYAVMTTDLRSQLDKLHTPVLLIGAAGGFTDRAQQTLLKELYADQLSLASQASLVMNNNGRHFLMWDEPEWLTQTIVNQVEAWK
ncbi:alpha/beta hydrolase [Thalassotalea sp. 1_MG-2023]|uniref:alpha/beta fold hydrolase n=1 Tax=Thalassotalea sp. 1_MG-2023 TaxID=3062680 RepID=UPI0026E2F17A|nr:alpha/beta hydrolase [Thalassotalea sp. 1_MG-2023]MDO6427336.1 alpha/beta hydrolase [Thalassotalea sp. 1_MG-2023]